VSTYGAMQSRVADDLNRTDLTSQIQQNLLLAIEHYKNERFWFNETNSTASATVSSAQVAAPSDLLAIDKLYIVISNKNIELIPRSLNQVVEFRPTNNGRPRAFCYYRDQFELDRKCDTAYTLNLYYLKQLAALSASSDTNGWTTDAEDLIVFHAEKKIYANIIKDAAKAFIAEQQEKDALQAVRSLRMARTSSGYTVAHYL